MQASCILYCILEFSLVIILIFLCYASNAHHASNYVLETGFYAHIIEIVQSLPQLPSQL